MHIDWREWDGTDVKVFVILDDASLMVLVGGEFFEINTENSKLVVDQLVNILVALSHEGADIGSRKRTDPNSLLPIAK